MEHVDLLRIHRNHFLPYVKANPDLFLGMLSLLASGSDGPSIIEDTAFLGFPTHWQSGCWSLRSIIADRKRATLRSRCCSTVLRTRCGPAARAITRQLALWRAAGIVETARRVIVVRDREALRALIDCS
jgi:hypothetical protein